MTRDDLDKLSPRELDAVVAERVMGWVWRKHPRDEEIPGWRSMYPPDATPMGLGESLVPWPEGNYQDAGRREVAPRYSTTGDGMLAAIERMESEHDACLCADGGCVWFESEAAQGPDVAYTSVAELPGAICKAAVLYKTACEGVGDA